MGQCNQKGPCKRRQEGLIQKRYGDRNGRGRVYVCVGVGWGKRFEDAMLLALKMGNGASRIK